MDWHSSCFMSHGIGLLASSVALRFEAAEQRDRSRSMSALRRIMGPARSYVYLIILLLSQRLARLQERRKPRPALRECILPAIPVGLPALLPVVVVGSQPRNRDNQLC